MSTPDTITQANKHLLDEIIYDVNAPPEFRYIAVCACSNPDSTGDGATEFRSDSIEGATGAWLGHFVMVVP